MSEDHWDVDSHKNEYEAEEHWQLRRSFILAHRSTVAEDRLVGLSHLLVNIESLGCSYPSDVMIKIAELGKDVITKYRESKKDRFERSFISASEAARLEIYENRRRKKEKQKRRGKKGEAENKENSSTTVKLYEKFQNPSDLLSTVNTSSSENNNETLGIITSNESLKIANGLFPGFVLILDALEKEHPMSVIQASASLNNQKIKFRRDQAEKKWGLYMNETLLASESGPTVKSVKDSLGRSALDKLKKNCFCIKAKTHDFSSDVINVVGSAVGNELLSPLETESPAAKGSNDKKLNLENELVPSVYGFTGNELPSLLETESPAAEESKAETLHLKKEFGPIVDGSTVGNELPLSLETESAVGNELPSSLETESPAAEESKDKKLNLEKEFGSNNVGLKIMKLMGWEGGPLGRNQQGIEEAIKPTRQAFRKGLGLIQSKKEKKAVEKKNRDMKKERKAIKKKNRDMKKERKAMEKKNRDMKKEKKAMEKKERDISKEEKTAKNQNQTETKTEPDENEKVVTKKRKQKSVMNLLKKEVGALCNNRSGLGLNAPTVILRRENLGQINGNTDMPLFRLTFKKYLLEWIIKSNQDLVISGDFDKMERTAMHKIAQQYSLPSGNFKKGGNYKKVIHKSFYMWKVVEDLAALGGSSDKYELIYPTET